MNAEQILDYLTDLSTHTKKTPAKNEEISASRKFLAKTSQNTHVCINYISCNYTDVDVVQPVIAHILALYYKGGALRQYALQYVPPFIGVYLFASSKKQHKSASIFETFFLAIYNEEILEPSQINPYAKKVEEVRIPSIRYPSIYHDPLKLNTVPEIVTIKPGSNPIVQNTVRLGPYPTMDSFTAEKKFMILTRIMRSVNGSLVYGSSDVVSRHVCLCTLSVCQSGFNMPESDLRAKVFDSDCSFEVLEDYSKKPRIPVSSHLMIELLTGVYLALYNGAPELALRALDSAHQRAQYEFLSDVLLVTNSMRNSLLENPMEKERREELWGKLPKERRRKDLVTNSSLRMKKLPDDIPVQETKEKEHSAFDDIVEGVDQIKKKMSALSHHHRGKRRKSHEMEELELSTINEDDDSSRRRRDSEDEKKKEEKNERGAFNMHTFRHADSVSSSARSD